MTDYYKETIEFDSDRLVKDISTNSDGSLKSLREIEAECGVSASSLSRYSNGAIPDMDTFMKIILHYNLNASNYFIKVKWTGKVDD